MGAARESVGSGFLLEILVKGEIRNHVPLVEFLEVIFSVTAHDLPCGGDWGRQV